MDGDGSETEETAPDSSLLVKGTKVDHEVLHRLVTTAGFLGQTLVYDALALGSTVTGNGRAQAVVWEH